MTALSVHRLSEAEDPLSSRTLLFVRYCWYLFVVIAIVEGSLLGAALQTGARPLSLSEALESTLRNHPALRIQDYEVEIARGAKQQASGQFDASIQSGLQQVTQDVPITDAQRIGLPASLQGINDQVLSSTNYNFNINKVLRSGASITSFAIVDRSKDNFVNQSGLSTSQVGVQLTVPLRRARGADVVDANERAARTEVGARALDRVRLVEQLLANTASSYWGMVAAKARLSVALDSEQRGRTLVETVQTLIEADHVARNDIYQVRANLADRTANRIAAEQAVAQSRVQLALDMGLSANELDHVGDPSDDFPASREALAAPDDEIVEAYVQEAMTHRADLEAAEEREKEAMTLYRAARNAIEPQVNWQLSAGYTQLRDNGSLMGFFGSTFTALHRPDVQTGIVYQFSRGNQTAKGQLVQAHAKVREAELQKADLQRQITAAVNVAVSDVRNSALRLKNAREAVDAFQKTLDGERQKFALGQSSLTELLTVEDRLTTSASREVDAQQAYAAALAELRLATGTMGFDSGGRDGIAPQLFQTVPELSISKGPR